tara:strand:+ start:495 stop:863 length:369 start_codon:yes stop_codon:yes gene_type:complete
MSEYGGILGKVRKNSEKYYEDEKKLFRETLVEKARKQLEEEPHYEVVIEDKDMVNHPEHYMKGGMETIEYLKAKSTPHGFQTYLRLNAMKYLSRAEEKENLVQDLEKALWYLNRLIKEMKGN